MRPDRTCPLRSVHSVFLLSLPHDVDRVGSNRSFFEILPTHRASTPVVPRTPSQASSSYETKRKDRSSKIPARNRKPGSWKSDGSEGNPGTLHRGVGSRRHAHAVAHILGRVTSNPVVHYHYLHTLHTCQPGTRHVSRQRVECMHALVGSKWQGSFVFWGCDLLAGWLLVRVA